MPKNLLISVLMLFLLRMLLPANDTTRVLIIYYSWQGHTRAMAEAVAEGARSVPSTEVKLLKVSQAKNSDVLAADAIIVGSPVYNANVAPPVQSFINRWPFRGAPLRDKIGAAFTSAGGISAGEELVQLNILHSMLIFGMIVVGGPDWRTAFGASAVTEEAPFTETEERAVRPHFLQKARSLGERVATLAHRWKKSRIKREEGAGK